MWGHIDTWFYRALAGIRSMPACPGFKRICIQPYIPADLKWVRAAMRTSRGRVASGWVHDKGSLKLKISIPVNTTAEIKLPSRQIRGDLRPRTDGILSVKTDKRWTTLQVGSGDYNFECGWVD